MSITAHTQYSKYETSSISDAQGEFEKLSPSERGWYLEAALSREPIPFMNEFAILNQLRNLIDDHKTYWFSPSYEVVRKTERARDGKKKGLDIIAALRSQFDGEADVSFALAQAESLTASMSDEEAHYTFKIAPRLDRSVLMAEWGEISVEHTKSCLGSYLCNSFLQHLEQSILECRRSLRVPGTNILLLGGHYLWERETDAAEGLIADAVSLLRRYQPEVNDLDHLHAINLYRRLSDGPVGTVGNGGTACIAWPPETLRADRDSAVVEFASTLWHETHHIAFGADGPLPENLLLKKEVRVPVSRSPFTSCHDPYHYFNEALAYLAHLEFDAWAIDSRVGNPRFIKAISDSTVPIFETFSEGLHWTGAMQGSGVLTKLGELLCTDIERREKAFLSKENVLPFEHANFFDRIYAEMERVCGPEPSISWRAWREADRGR